MLSFRQWINNIKYKFDDSRVYEMSNLQPDDTGLKPIVHVMYKGGAKHGPRVKVSNIVGTFHPHDNFSVSLEPEPDVVAGDCKLKSKHLDNIKDWVKLNRDHLHHVWHHGDEMTGSQIDAGFKKL